MSGSKSTITDLPKALAAAAAATQGDTRLTEAVRLVIDLAEAGEFHDYKNQRFAMPKVMLVKLLGDLGPDFDDIRQEVMNGDYDEPADDEDVASMKKSWLDGGGTEAQWNQLFEPPTKH